VRCHRPRMAGHATPTIIIVAVVNYPRDDKAVLSVLYEVVFSIIG